MSKYATDLFPRAVEIQTISTCNAGCVICPHPDVSPDLPSGVMSSDLFREIIDQLSDHPQTLIIPYLNSEPFLDPDFVDRLRYIDDKCSGSNVEVSTNVSRLDIEKQNDLADAAELHELRLSVFGFTRSTYSSVMPLLDYDRVMQNLFDLATNDNLRKSVQEISLTMINYPDLSREDFEKARNFCQSHNLQFNHWGFLDRSRNVEEYSNEYYQSEVSGCEQSRPLNRLHITWQGKVVFCCQDWRQQHILGSVKEDSIVDVWRSDLYREYRQAVYSENRDAPELCKKCKLSH